MLSTRDHELINLLIIADEAQNQGDDLWLVEDLAGELILYFKPPPAEFRIIEIFKGR